MLTGLLRKAALAHPSKTAIVYGDERISYGELQRRARQCAAGLREFGVGEGDCVAVALPNCPEFVITFFACAGLGAILLPLNPLYRPGELQRFVADAEAKLILGGTSNIEMCRVVAAAQPRQVHVAVVGEAPGAIAFSDLCANAGPADDRAPCAGRALYLYTSGSTDTYKRVCCTQENLYFEARNFVDATGIGPDDAILCTIPLHHSYGLGNCLLDAVYTGAALVLEPDAEAPFAARDAGVLELLEKEQVRVFPGVPFQFEVLAASTQDVRAAFRQVQWCISSGDVLPKRTFDRFLARTGHPIRSLYGSTEAGSIAMDVGPASEVRFGSLGSPLENVTIQVRGEAGEIWVKSPTIPPGGYDDRPEINRQVFQGGFYNTGDLGRLDEQGRLVMTGRKQSFFDVGGHKVDLGEVEEVLLGHPKVREAAAIGIEVENFGGVIKAVVVAHEACRETDILEFCRTRLAPFKVPRLLEFREVLPRSPLGKLLRGELLDQTSWLSDVPSARELPSGARAHQIDWLAQRIGAQVAAVLACEPDEIARDVPFQSLGLDSLRVVELQERLSRMSGVALTITTLWNHPSIDAYAAFLRDAMEGPQPPAPFDELDDLADDEVAAMLARELNMTDDGP